MKPLRRIFVKNLQPPKIYFCQFLSHSGYTIKFEITGSIPISKTLLKSFVLNIEITEDVIATTLSNVPEQGFFSLGTPISFGV